MAVKSIRRMRGMSVRNHGFDTSNNVVARPSATASPRLLCTSMPRPKVISAAISVVRPAGRLRSRIAVHITSAPTTRKAVAGNHGWPSALRALSQPRRHRRVKVRTPSRVGPGGGLPGSRSSVS